MTPLGRSSVVVFQSLSRRPNRLFPSPNPMPAKKRPSRPAKRKARTARPAKKPDTIASISDRMRTVTPHLICAGAIDAIEFYKRAFGAVEEMRIPGLPGKLLHAAIRIGDSIVLLVDEYPQWGALGPKALRGSPVIVHLVVPNVDRFVARAVKAGAKITMPVADMFWGERYGKIEDPFGHQWSVATHLRDMTPEEMQAAARTLLEGGAH